jgi:hypothetical protein
MTLSLQSALSLATVLVAIVLAYASLKYSVLDLGQFRLVADRKIEKLEIHVSHLQSWLDEVKVKR